MKNTLTVLFISAVLVSLTGCGIANAVNDSCNLSSLKIKGVTLEGDTDGLVSGAIERELFAQGALSDNAGVQITGKVVQNTGSIPGISVVVRADGKAFAGVGMSQLIDPDDSAGQIGRRIAKDFCRCSAGRQNDPKPSVPQTKPKKQ